MGIGLPFGSSAYHGNNHIFLGANDLYIGTTRYFHKVTATTGVMQIYRTTSIQAQSRLDEYNII